MARVGTIAAGIIGLLTEWVIALVVMRVLAQRDAVLLAFLVLALTGVSAYLWKQAKLDWISRPGGCLKFAGLTPVFGAVVFCFDMILGQILHPLSNPFDAAMRTGPIGGALTVIATLLMEIVAIGSLARSLVLAEFESRSA